MNYDNCTKLSSAYIAISPESVRRVGGGEITCTLIARARHCTVFNGISKKELKMYLVTSPFHLKA